MDVWSSFEISMFSFWAIICNFPRLCLGDTSIKHGQARMEMQLLQLAEVMIWICHLDSFGLASLHFLEEF